MFYKINYLKNFEKFTRKHLYWTLYFDKVAGLRQCLQKFDFGTHFKLLSENSCKICSRNYYYGNHSKQNLLLSE